MSSETKKRGTHLAHWKRQEAARTSEQLGKALDRFESGKLTRLPKGAKLTRLNLATEAGVAKDTPYSRFRKGHPNVGQYRFPQIVDRFIQLRKKLGANPKGRPKTDDDVYLKKKIAKLESMLSASRCVVNAQDIQIASLNNRIRDLEERYAKSEEERNRLEGELIKLRRKLFK